MSGHWRVFGGSLRPRGRQRVLAVWTGWGRFSLHRGQVLCEMRGGTGPVGQEPSVGRTGLRAEDGALVATTHSSLDGQWTGHELAHASSEGRGAWVASVRGELWGVPQAGLSHELGKDQLLLLFLLLF